MAFLVIAGVVVEMTTPFRERAPARVGAFSRGFSGAGRSSVRAGTAGAKRSWEGTTIPMTPAAIATLQTALGGGTPSSAAVALVYGAAVDVDLEASAFAAFVSLDTVDYLPVDATSHQRSVSVVVEAM